jgi:hypothetical protein
MPELVGLYHAYVKGFNKDVRHHKLFIVVSGGCNLLSDKFYNLSVDIRGGMSVVMHPPPSAVHALSPR